MAGGPPCEIVYSDTTSISRRQAVPVSNEKWLQTGGGLDVHEMVSKTMRKTDALVGKSLGNYHVDALIAEGGMGRVYRGHRTDGAFSREVAIKILPQGQAHQIADRFELERHILARMTHPNIAQLYDAGVSELGSPYIVMELVEGLPIDAYAESLNVRKKTKLILRLAEVLEFAHAGLVVHRDLKPTNILIAEDGSLKLLDFGIAKILEAPGDLTVDGRPLTPRFSSPEQIRGEPVTVATDIYQVGLVFLSLFEPTEESAKADESTLYSDALEKKDVTARSRITEELPIELEAVINKCLRFDARERYLSASELVGDLNRFLNGYPVSARNPGPLRSGYKFFRRHWLPSTAILVAFLSLAVLLVTSVRQQEITEAARDSAQHQQVRAEATTQFLLDLFRASAPDEAMGADLSAEDLLERGRRRIESQELDPVLEAELNQTIGSIYQDLGKIESAVPLVERALEIRLAEQPHDPSDLADTMSLLSALYQKVGRLGESVELSRRAYEIAVAEFGHLHKNTISTLGTFGFALQRAERYDEARIALAEVLEKQIELHGNDHVEVATAMNNLAVLYAEQGRLGDALRYSEKVLQWDLENLPDNHPWTAAALYNHGANLIGTGRFSEALICLERSLDIRNTVAPEDYVWLGRTIRGKANALRGLGEFSDSLALRLEAHRLMKMALSEPNPSLARMEIGIAASLVDTGEYDMARRYLSSAEQQFRSLGRTTSGYLESIKLQEARISIAESDFTTAIKLLEKVSTGEIVFSSHLQVDILLAQAFRMTGDLNAANHSIEKALAAVAARTGRLSTKYYDALIEKAGIQVETGDFEGALQSLQTHRTFYEERVPESHWHLATNRLLSRLASVDSLWACELQTSIKNELDVLRSTFAEQDPRLVIANAIFESCQSRGDSA